MLFRFQGSVCLLLASLATCLAGHSRPAFGEDPPTQSLPQPEWEARIEAALDAKGDWSFEDIPLKDVCAALQEKLGIDIVLDVKALEDFGIDTQTPITRSLGGISNRSFLRLMLSDLELRFTKQFGALWITTPEVVESRLVTKVYPVSDLLAHDPDFGDQVVDYDSLQQAIMSVIAPSAWDQVGGAGAIAGIYGSLVVSQSEEVHEQVAMFLHAYREIVENDSDARQETAYFARPRSNEAIHAALDKPLTAELEDIPLRDVIEFLTKAANVPIVLDAGALEDFGIDTGTPVNLRVKDIPLRFALARILNDLELVDTIRDEVLFITTREVEESKLLIGFYPVRDLVQIGTAPPDDASGIYSDFDALIQTISSTIAPDSWDEVGGPGAIEPMTRTPTLVISQTRSSHEQIAELLTKLREAKKLDAAGRSGFDPQALTIRSYQVEVSKCSSDDIAKLVVRASEPGTWSDDSRTFVQGLGGSIVVKHKASVHRRIQKLLFDIGVGYYGGGFGGLGGIGSGIPAENQPMPKPAPESGGGGFF